MKTLVERTTQITAFDEGEFRAPDVVFQPIYTWIWNAPLARGEIGRQLEDMAAAGIRSCYILPEPPEFRPGSMVTTLSPEYLSDEFMELVSFALHRALELGIAVWMYDEGGWPSGAACGKVRETDPSLARKGLAAGESMLAAHTPYAPGDSVLAAFETQTGVRLRAGETRETDTPITEYYVRYEFGYGVDPFEEGLGEAFVRSTHERYAAFAGDLFDGRVPAMFTDEPGGSCRPWPRGFEGKFKAAYGCDPCDYLPAILGDARTEAESRARIDYGMLAGELFRRNYLVPIHDWCRKNGVLSTGHLNHDQTIGGTLDGYGNVMSLLRELDIPGVDVIWRQVYPAAGAPPCREGNGFFPRFASSAAAQTGKKFAVSESFGVYGSGLTAGEMRYVINFQLARGVNLINVMNAVYGKGGALALAERPFFTSETPGYNHLRAVNDYTARACYLMQLGKPKTHTALYYPVRDLWAGQAWSQQVIASFDSLGQRLERAHVDFDIIDDEAVLRASFEGGAMKLGLAEYRHVFIPDCRYMPDGVRERLRLLDSEIEPNIRTDDGEILARVRDLGGGEELYYLYNEAAGAREAMVALPNTLPAYELDLTDGRIYRADLSRPLSFLSGQSRVFLCTQKVPGVPKPVDCARRMPVDRFSLSKRRSFLIQQEGILSQAHEERFFPTQLGPWGGTFGDDFSGEAIYRANVSLDALLKDGSLLLLDLGRVESSARVFVNGQEAGIVSAAPFQLLIPASMIPAGGAFTLDIEVANTAANQCAAAPFEQYWPAREIGPYHKRTVVFEREAERGGLYGPVGLSIVE